MVKIFANEFERFDICLTGPELGFGPYYVPIFHHPPIVMLLGPVPVWFSKYICLSNHATKSNIHSNIYFMDLTG